MNVKEKAFIFAAAAHAAVGQKRKYTGEDYIVHPIAVAAKVAEFGDDDMVAAALLHDVVEDTHITIDHIKHHFGFNVTRLVKGLTDVSRPEDGNREERKRLDRDHIARGAADVQLIKCADMIDNAKSIFEHDKSFALLFAREKRLLLDIMRDSVKESDVWKEADEILVQFDKKLKFGSSPF